MLALLTSLVEECGQIEVTGAKKTMNRVWHWDDVHQTAFANVKATITKDVALTYPDY